MSIYRLIYKLCSRAQFPGFPGTDRTRDALKYSVYLKREHLAWRRTRNPRTQELRQNYKLEASLSYSMRLCVCERDRDRQKGEKGRAQDWPTERKDNWPAPWQEGVGLGTSLECRGGSVARGPRGAHSVTLCRWHVPCRHEGELGRCSFPGPQKQE